MRFLIPLGHRLDILRHQNWGGCVNEVDDMYPLTLEECHINMFVYILFYFTLSGHQSHFLSTKSKHTLYLHPTGHTMVDSALFPRHFNDMTLNQHGKGAVHNMWRDHTSDQSLQILGVIYHPAMAPPHIYSFHKCGRQQCWCSVNMFGLPFFCTAKLYGDGYLVTVVSTVLSEHHPSCGASLRLHSW